MGNRPHARPTAPKTVMPAITVNATHVELQQISATHAGLMLSNSAVTAQIPVDADQLRQIAQSMLNMADDLAGAILVPAQGLQLP